MTTPVNLETLDSNGLKQFLDSFDHVFSDCDGVIWGSGGPLKGSGEFIELMKKIGKTVHFVSNNSIRTQQNYENQFKAAGVQNGYENLTIPSLAIKEFLKSKNFTKAVYCVTCPETKRVLQDAGFKTKEGPASAPGYDELGQFFDDDPEVGAVLLDCDTNLNLPKIYRCVTYLERDDVLYLSGATDKYWATKRGIAIGAGFFTQLVSEEAKRQPIQLGKPGKIFGEFAMKRAGVTDPGRVLFIGDMLEQDVGLGKNTGFKTFLVLSHHTVEEMQSQDRLRPDYYAGSLGTVVPVLKKYL
ncbi:uncharacterized protein LOC106137529 [Amyelois transitella]|uniref:uncharacterized protein LOC106137529 n=1 Tax=Amyelois transitella TaxID=680683 RepID=UPI00298FFB90|nr:uncharacterized protein LOC106137529 [Amyelois transitella]XP_060801506.1 uncharacterized protein LOC106137529 [Amyelois transitella]